MRAYHAVVVIVLAIAASASGEPDGQPILLRSENLTVTVEQAALQRQFDALMAMPNVRVAYSIRGPISTITGETGLTMSADMRALKERDSAEAVLDELGPVLLAAGGETLAVWSHEVGAPRVRRLRLKESIRGIPVLGGRVRVEYSDDPRRRILNIEAKNFLPDRDLVSGPSVSAGDAREAVVHALAVSGDAVAGSIRSGENPSLSYMLGSPDDSRVRLAWGVEVSFNCPTGSPDSQFVWVDAIDKGIIWRQPLSGHPPNPCQAARSPRAECEAAPDPSIEDSLAGSSCASDASGPRLIVARVGCANRYRLSWARIPGVSYYYVVRARPDLGWAFAEIVVGDYVHQCTTDLEGPTLLKLRACGSRGCGPWSEPQSIDPASECAE